MLQRDDLLEVVVSDLEFLRDTWDQDVDDQSLRRSSPILRRLLVDNELQRAWKAAGFEREPRVSGSTLTGLIAVVPNKNIVFAAAGGAKFKDAEMRGAIQLDTALTPEAMRELHARGVPSIETGLREFVESPSVVVHGQVIARRRVIKYVANKLGGAHHDTRRGISEEERAFSKLDKAATFSILEKPAVYFELLSAGQAIVASCDVSKLIDWFRARR